MKLFQKNPGRSTTIIEEEIQIKVDEIAVLVEELLSISDPESNTLKDRIDALIIEAQSHEMELERIRTRRAFANDLIGRLNPRNGGNPDPSI